MQVFIAVLAGGGIAFAVFYGINFIGAAVWWGSLILFLIAAIFTLIRSELRKKRAYAGILPALEKLGEADFTQICRQVKADTGVNLHADGYAEMHRLERLGTVEFKWSADGIRPKRMLWRVTPREEKATVISGRFGGSR